MTVTSQRPLKILIRYKKRSLSSLSLFLKVKWPSDCIKSGQLPTKCFGFGKYTRLYVHKRAKMAMLVIVFEDLQKPVENFSFGYCASRPPLALSKSLESGRYREV